MTVVVPLFRITVAQAMEALCRCARRPQTRQVAAAGEREPSGPALLDEALALFGFRPAELFGDHLATLQADLPLVVSPFFTVGAVVAFRAAARAELGGASWPQAVCAAHHDVLRLSVTVPE